MSEINLPPSGLAEEILPNFTQREGEFHLVTFDLGEEYGVPISQVHEIIRTGSITIVPNSPAYMEGVINLRGRVLPVLNLRKKLKLPVRDITKSSRIIVTEIGRCDSQLDTSRNRPSSKVVGLLVDAVAQVIKVPSNFVESAPEEVLEVDTDYITGVGKLQNRLVILLDLEKLLRREKIELPETG